MDSETFWLNTTNIVLGLVTLVCLVMVGRVAFQEIMVRIKNHATATVHDDHALFVSELGLTMADGGEKIGAKKDSHQSLSTDNESNIIRSEN